MIDKQKQQAMQEGGRKLSLIKKKVISTIVPGISLAQVDNLADSLLKKSGGEPGFKLVPGYKWATCININSGIVHGIPHPHIKINQGDLVSVDMGLFYQGFHTDTSTTVIVGKPLPGQNHFLEIGKQALNKGIKEAKPGNRVGHISRALQKVVEKAGFSCARNLTGHGIGRSLHEPPMVPCLLRGDISYTPRLTEGMTLAIEIIYNQGNWQTKKANDSWTIETKDGKLSGLFEETILITKNHPQILTK